MLDWLFSKPRLRVLSAMCSDASILFYATIFASPGNFWMLTAAVIVGTLFMFTAFYFEELLAQ